MAAAEDPYSDRTPLWVIPAPQPRCKSVVPRFPRPSLESRVQISRPHDRNQRQAGAGDRPYAADLGFFRKLFLSQDVPVRLFITGAGAGRCA